MLFEIMEIYKSGMSLYKISNWDTLVNFIWVIRDCNKGGHYTTKIIFKDSKICREYLIDKTKKFNFNFLDISDVKSLLRLFYNFPYDFDVSEWDVSNVENFIEVFHNASKFTGDISKWDVSNGTNFSYMFHSALKFNSPLNDWNVSNGKNFNSMFFKAASFNLPLNKWKMNKMEDMSYMFKSAIKFYQDLSSCVFDLTQQWFLTPIDVFNYCPMIRNEDYLPTLISDIKIWKDDNGIRKIK